jgi:uncharacterized protein (DUF736 family)
MHFGKHQIGTGEHKLDNGKGYIEITIDDPFLPEPIRCELRKRGWRYVLEWNRPLPVYV